MSLFNNGLKAQTNFLFSWYLINDNNTFKNKNQYSELINTATFFAGKSQKVKSFKLQGFYNAHMSVFNEYPDLKNHSHKLGITGRFEKNNYVVNIGANAQLRRNNAQYIYYNTDLYNLYLNLRYEPDITKNYSFGLTMVQNNFNEFSDINNFTYRFYGRYQQFFKNRLSLLSEAGIGVKNYPNQTLILDYGYGEEFFQVYRISEEPVTALIFSVFANIGKSLTDNTGMNATIGGQKFIGDPIECFINGIYYFTENDLYDDPYSYENMYISLNLTRQFTVGFQGKMGMQYNKKNYRGTPALNVEGDFLGTTRQDTRKEYYFLLSKKFETEWKFPKSIELFFRFLIRDNISNDPYYEFTDHLGILGLSIRK